MSTLILPPPPRPRDTERCPPPPPEESGPRPILSRRSPLGDLLAHAADEPARQPGVTLLGALHLAAARLDAPAALVAAAIEACGSDPDTIGVPARDAIFAAWRRLA